ncbi:glycosyltransferase family A protein [Mangrovimonas sp. YM274]|uniref:glycosyltransferase family 2 protein n=1 Tax=Mangrovimonas sp. YM274 TaxID=3070660 RepID=UPI0027DC84DB|nr:glycosyltransferase family A protein [Mangrovimonas sp. YM274]WMI68455.1 glycosyltransferase family A protein [Mangrovimonas sp. YM274]
MITVSIVVPVYNRADVVGETIQSVFKQTYSNWELLLVDDGSKDNTRDVLSTLSSQDCRIKIYYREAYSNVKGAPVCRNIGLNQAIGTYVMFLDSDDILRPDALENRLTFFWTKNDCDFLVFPGAFFNREIEDSDRLWNKFTEENDLLRFLRGDVVWQTTGPIWKRSYLLEQGLKFDETAASSQDWEFHIHSLLKHPKYSKIDVQPDYFVRRDDNESGRISGGHSSVAKFQNRIELINKLLKVVIDPKQLRALHKYLVRDTVSCLRNEALKPILDTFKSTNNKFSKSIAENWNTWISLVYRSLKLNSALAFRIIARLIDLRHPGYFRGFKMHYRAKY